MRRRVPAISSTDTVEAVEVPTLTTPSAHHRKSDKGFAISAAKLTAAAWINATAETILAAKPYADRVWVSIYKLSQVGERYVVTVSRTVEKTIEVEPNNPSVFVKHDAGSGQILDEFFSGEGPGSQIREADAIALLEAWAATVNPDPQARVNAARALTMKIALRRGVVMHYGEAF